MTWWGWITLALFIVLWIWMLVRGWIYSRGLKVYLESDVEVGKDVENGH